MFKRNPGRFNHVITLLKPGQYLTDELGGVTQADYEPVLELKAMCEQRSQTRQQIIADYVTIDTRYFVVRDVRAMVPDLGKDWRLQYNGFTYHINEITLIDESRPYFMQITATAANAGGGAI